ncbi:MAG: gamma-glutamyltransferase, partial [Pseudomonadota bacterium]
MNRQIGVVAAGHEETARAAEVILRAGGNAFDAVVAAHFAACVAEPVLASLGGGGFLMVHTAEGTRTLYDFFTQTPKNQRPEQELDFYPISANFGTARQEFHIGLGAAACPGTVKGLFATHRDLCSLPMARLVEPAVDLARRGVVMNAFQAYIFDIVKVIYESREETRKIYQSPSVDGYLIREGENHYQHDLADCLDALAREGEALFYRGEIARSIDSLCRDGGHLTRGDLKGYEVIRRKPLALEYRDAALVMNPPPSSGGMLVAFALKLLAEHPLGEVQFGDVDHLQLLVNVLAAACQARIDAHLDENDQDSGARMLDRDFVALYRDQVKGRARCSRGTTHISVMDRMGNVASLTTSNGEGCGRMIPGTGVMLNNMLGEADINPFGFHRWQANQRMTSMMDPSIVILPGNRKIALGSGGSNRIRTAILQVLVNLIDFKMDLRQAVCSPRLHFEDGHLSIEAGFPAVAIERLTELYPDYKLWSEKNLFFGGAHSV